MHSKKLDWKVYLSLIIIIALSWIENQYITESVGVEAVKRKLLHFIFLAGIQVTGYAYWFKHSLSWMKQAWMAAYFGMFALLLFIGVCNWRFHFLSTTFLDQVHYVRTFFCSPLPFIITIVLSRMDLKNLGATEQRLNRIN